MVRIARQRTLTEPVGPGGWGRWFAFLGGAGAWTVHIGVAYVAGEFGCVGGWGAQQVMGVTVSAWIVIAVTVLAVVVALAATWAGYRGLGGRVVSETGHQSDAAKYLSWSGLMLSGLFAVIIIGQSVPIVSHLHRC
jgi:hypothetical protein